MNDNQRYVNEVDAMSSEWGQPEGELRRWQLLGFSSWDSYMCWLDYTNADPKALPHA